MRQTEKVGRHSRCGVTVGVMSKTIPRISSHYFRTSEDKTQPALYKLSVLNRKAYHT